jgi:plastocyanin
MVKSARRSSGTGSNPGDSWHYGIVSAFVGLLVVLVLGLGILVARGSFAERPDPGADAAQVQQASAGEALLIADEFSFTPRRIEFSADDALSLRNEGATYHDLVIEGIDGFRLTAHPGDSDSGNIQLPPGRYLAYCSIPGHREAGMIAELVIR